MDELKQVYLKKLAMVLSMEDLIIEHLPMMIEKSTNDKLKTGLSDHLTETREHRNRLTKILASHGAAASVESDDAFKMMLEHAGKEIGMITDKDVRDAVIIAAAQAVEHLEMAKYGTLVEWAKQLDDSDGKSMLKDTLGEEEAADKKLSGIAEGGLFSTGVNKKAAE
jgi:ferritin-like metal-binding protein YciE